MTGWFREFAELAEARVPSEVRYGKGPARFAGATFDPASQYRGAAVMDFFHEQGLTSAFLALDVRDAPDAARLCAVLKERGVLTDCRGATLRFGPAPYLSEAQLAAAMQALAEVARQ